MSLVAATDALLVAAWLGLVLDVLPAPRRQRVARGDGDRAARGPSRAIRLGVLAGLVAGAALLEHRTGGRLWSHPVAAAAGLACAGGGLLLHMRARRALGVRWSSAVAVPPGHEVVTRGPYAHVRHPIYLGVLLLALGTALAHPSAATLCLAGGLAAGMALKIPAEERALRATCGEAWLRYAAEVPALLPRLFSRASR